jgi:hypothetical protein
VLYWHCKEQPKRPSALFPVLSNYMNVTLLTKLLPVVVGAGKVALLLGAGVCF